MNDIKENLGLGARPGLGRKFARELDWNLLKLFHEIAQAGGVSRAARQLSRKQPALSLALSRLEDHLGVRLCRRGPGGFDLSDEGQLIAETCAKIAHDVSQIPNRVADLSEELHGRIRVMLISNLVDPSLDQVLQSFHRSHPFVEIFITVATWDVVARAVLRGEVEVGIAPAHHKTAELEYDFLFKEIHRPYCGRSHPLFGRTFEDPRRLAGEAFILTGADEPEQLSRFRLRYGLGRHVAGLSEHLEEAKRLAVLGVGICFLPEAYAANDSAKGLLHPLLPPLREPSMENFIITNPKSPRHPARERFLEEVRKCIAAE